MEKQLFESLSYIEIKRGFTRPVKLDEILQRRMDDFLSRQLERIGSGNFKVRDL